jgi:nuclear GTP-binding protein
MQRVALDGNVSLLDCPGIIFATGDARDDSATAVLRNALRVDDADDVLRPAELIVQRCRPALLARIYKLPLAAAAASNTTEVLWALACARGRLRPGGGADLEAAARVLVQDWQQGRIPFYTEPPPEPEARGSAAQVGTVGGSVLSEPTVVDSFAPAFDIDALMATLDADNKAAIDALPAVVVLNRPAEPDAMLRSLNASSSASACGGNIDDDDDDDAAAANDANVSMDYELAVDEEAELRRLEASRKRGKGSRIIVDADDYDDDDDDAPGQGASDDDGAQRRGSAAAAGAKRHRRAQGGGGFSFAAAAWPSDESDESDESDDSESSSNDDGDMNMDAF